MKTTDSVWQITTTVGTGTLSLGAAVAGYRSLAVAVADGDLTAGDTVPYRIEAVDSNGNPTGDFEVGSGVVGSGGTTLSRITVDTSSNSDSLVSFSAGTKYIFLTEIIITQSLGTAAYQDSSAFDTAGAAAAAQAASQPVDSDLTAIAALSTTAYGRAFLALADAAAGRTALGLGTLATQNGTFSGISSGTNTGDQTITLTGGVTGSGTGSFVATVATNANLTGPITSAGNATSIASQTGTGSTFVMQASPILTTPNIGTPSAGTLTNCSGLPESGVTNLVSDLALKAPLASPALTGTPTSPTAAALTNTTQIASTAFVTAAVATAVTGALLSANNLSDVANATTALTNLGGAAPTGTGAIVRKNNAALVTPDLGTPSALVATNATGTASGLTAGTVTTNANLTGDVTSVGNATTLTNAPVIAKVLTGYTSGAGTIAATDSILQAIQKLNGNDATNANLTGDVTSVGNATTLATVNSNVGSFTNSSITVNAKGLVIAASSGASAGLTVGTTTITSGTTTRVLYDNAGVVGEYTITGTGNVVMSASPTLTGTLTGAAATFSGQVTSSLNGAASTPPLTLTGTWFTGGSATTTKPQLLVEPSGTTSTGWSTSGTGIGVNAASGFVGNLIDAQINSQTAFGVVGNTYQNSYITLGDPNGRVSSNNIGFKIGRNLGGVDSGQLEFQGYQANNAAGFTFTFGSNNSTDSNNGFVVRNNSKTQFFNVGYANGGFVATSVGTGTLVGVFKGAASRTVALSNYQTSAAGSLGNVSGGCFADIIATTSTTHTDGTFDTLSTITFVANSLIVNADKHYFDYTLTVVGHAITTTDVKIAFGGITIFDSGALPLGTGTSTIRLKGYISRVTSTTCEASIEWNVSGGSGIVPASADIQTFTGTGTLTGMTLSGTNNLVLSAASASTNAASGDISVVHGTAGIISFGS